METARIESFEQHTRSEGGARNVAREVDMVGLKEDEPRKGKSSSSGKPTDAPRLWGQPGIHWLQDSSTGFGCRI